MEQPINQFDTTAKNNPVLLPIIISVILTAIIVGGGIYWWANQKQSELNNELVKTKFELAILNFWQVRQVFQDPQNKNKFYYVTNFDDGSDIWVYDLAKDKTYRQDGTFNFNIPEGNTLLLSQKLAKYQEFRGVGILSNKFVFVETSSDNSPGPCFSPWFYSNLEYIDLGISKPTRKPFTLPEDLKRTEEQQATECQKTL